MKVLIKTRLLDFPRRIEIILDLVRKRPAMWTSPKRLEFQLCALLAAWEAIALGDDQSCHWLDIWQMRCRTLHRGRSGLTLADPVSVTGGRMREPVSGSETTKAYQRVRDGLRRVYKGTLDHYRQHNFDRSTETAEILMTLIANSFRFAKSFADPEGLEMYLLTLIELFECSLGREASNLHSRKLWRQEIQKKRALGPAATRTLADVIPLEERIERSRALTEKERHTILLQIIQSMQKIEREMHRYLVGQRRRAN